MTRWRTTDGAPKGKQACVWNWRSFDDLLRYRDEQRALMTQGVIPYRLFRLRVRRASARYCQMRADQIYWAERAREAQQGEQQ